MQANSPEDHSSCHHAKALGQPQGSPNFLVRRKHLYGGTLLLSIIAAPLCIWWLVKTLSGIHEQVAPVSTYGGFFLFLVFLIIISGVVGLLSRAWHLREYKEEEKKLENGKKVPGVVIVSTPASSTTIVKTSPKKWRRLKWTVVVLAIYVYLINPKVMQYLAATSPSFRKQFGIAEPRAARTYPNFQNTQDCSDDQKREVDITKMSDVETIGRVDIPLHEGGYCTHVVVPAHCSANHVCMFRKSTNHGDYATLWCNGALAPRPIRPQEVNYMSDPDQMAYNRGGDFASCPGPEGTTIDFFIQGRGTLTVILDRTQGY